MRLIGLTGSIGAGKTSVAALLVKRGARCIHSDLTAKTLLDSDPVVQEQIVSAFGAEMLGSGGAIDRQALAAKAFAKPENQIKLNSIMHPRVLEAHRQQAAQAKQEGVDLLVIDSPLLFEAGLGSSFDAVIVVVADFELRYQRIAERGGISRQDFDQRDSLQWSQEQKRAQADFVIENGGSLAALEQAVVSLWPKLATVLERRDKPAL